ncbi:hypothetical protein D299_gp260 [Escherichia phage HX01]|nr:hypothetical protein D299_gp260 [Escherichia phage HX01]
MVQVYSNTSYRRVNIFFKLFLP